MNESMPTGCIPEMVRNSMDGMRSKNGNGDPSVRLVLLEAESRRKSFSLVCKQKSTLLYRISQNGHSTSVRFKIFFYIFISLNLGFLHFQSGSSFRMPHPNQDISKIRSVWALGDGEKI